MKHRPENIDPEHWSAVESPPLSDELLNRMSPVGDNHPDRSRQVAGPQATKVRLSIGVAPEVVEYFKATGPGW
ncbi:MAG: BrnA antitoxin family protein [Methylococcales bacterium]